MISHRRLVWKLRMWVALTALVLLVSAGGPPLRGAEIDPTGAPQREARGRVLTPDGQPVFAARIEPYCWVEHLDWLSSRWSFGVHAFEQTTTDLNGVFSFAQPNHDRVGVRIIAAGFARTMLEVPYGARVTDIILGKGVTVTGRLLKDGQPVPDIEVGIAQVETNSQKFLEEIVARTDDDGRFILRDVAPHERYEIHGKRDSLQLLGVTGEIRVTTGEPESTLEAGDLLVEPGIKLTGRLMLADGRPPITKVEPLALPDGRQIFLHAVQLQVHRYNAYDHQWIDLEPDLHFTVLARNREEVFLSAWVEGHKTVAADRVLKVSVKPGLKPIEIVYVPE